MKRKIWRYFLLLFCTKFCYAFLHCVERYMQESAAHCKTPTGSTSDRGAISIIPHLFIVEQPQLSCFSESRKPVLGIRLQIRNLGSGLVECGILRPSLLSHIYGTFERKSEMLCEIFLRNLHFCILSLLHHLPNL